MADAQYVIDVAAGMSGGDATVGELDKLTATMLSAGKNAEHFQTAIKQTAAALDVAKVASVAANDALAAGADEYKLLESGANKAAREVEKLALAGKGLSREYAVAVQKAQAASSAVTAQASVVKTLEAAAGAATAKENALANTFKNVQKLSAHANAALAAKAETLEKLRGGLASIPGPAGKMGSALLAPAQGFAKLSASMGTTKAASLVLAAGLAGLVLAIVAVGVAALAGGVKVAAWAVGLADAKRSADLSVEALQAMTPELKDLSGIIGDITHETGLHADALNEQAAKLLKAGVSADQMATALRAAALAQKVGGSAKSDYDELVANATSAQKAVEEASKKAGGKVSKELTDKVNEASTALDDFSHKAVNNLGGIVARQMLGLEAQSDRLQSNLSDIFGGLNIDPVLAGMQKLVGLFDKNSAAGQAMKFLFEKIFQPIIDSADKAATVVEAFVLGFLIGLTKLYIQLKPAIKAVSEFFGFKDTSLTDVLAVAKNVGEKVAPVFAVMATIVGVTLAAAFAVVGAAIALVVAQWYATIKVVQFVIGIFSTLVSAIASVGSSVLTYLTGLWDQIVTFFSGKSLVEIGTQLMMGLVQGITGAISAVVQAVSNAVGAAIGAAKSALGIASPSKVFAQIGDYAGQGFADGVEGQTNAAQAAMTDMVAPPDAPTIAAGGVASGIASPADAAGGGASAPAGGAAAAGSSGRGGGANYADMFRGAVFQFGDGVDGKKAADDFVERTIELWERLAGQGGGAPA